MTSGIPQFIDVEDKVVGPFTLRQLGWIISGGLILFILWNVASFFVFIAAAIPICLSVGFLGFFRYNNRPATDLVWHAVVFLFHPKTYVWRKEEVHHTASAAPRTPVTEVASTAPRNTQDLRALANALDNTTLVHDEKINTILKRYTPKNISPAHGIIPRPRFR